MIDLAEDLKAANKAVSHAVKEIEHANVRVAYLSELALVQAYTERDLLPYRPKELYIKDNGCPTAAGVELLLTETLAAKAEETNEEAEGTATDVDRV